MPVKKAKKPSRSIRYLLFADRSLQKISLKKISERVRKARSAARSTRAKKGVPRKSAAVPFAMSGRAIALVVGVVVVAAALLAARQPSAPSADTIVAAAPAVAADPVPPQPAKRSDAKKPASKAPATAAAAKTSAVNVTTPATPEPVSVKPFVPEPAPETTVAENSTTTITGCVAADEGTFWLKNASGADVPKSRSWKSGFFKKRPASIELLDATHELRLTSYVGQRVAATGTLEDRELRARSVRRIAASCD